MQRKYVLLELEAPDEGTAVKSGGVMLDMKLWIWQDIFTKMNCDVKVLSARIVESDGVTEGFPNYDTYMAWRNNDRSKT